jgi:energy-coupling factor transport system permease protein
VIHRDRRSPLHAARAAVGAGWCLSLGATALSFEHPLALAAVLAAVAGAGVGARVGRELARALLWGLPFAALIAAINPLAYHDGVTVVFRGATLPWYGPLDITREAIVYGGVLGLRALALVGCAALLSAAVDPDELLRALRRVSLRSGVTAALATRLVPVLVRDARRVGEAQRCLPGGGASRAAVLRAVTAGALDRATDLAATLEVRGFAAPRRPPATARPWSRHDLAFAASALGLAALAVAGSAGRWAPFEAYPRTRAPLSATTWLVAIAIAACALAPFLDRRGLGR